jgi:hypothetical protein
LEKILLETHTPGISVAIVSRDGSKWLAGLGKADLGSFLADWQDGDDETNSHLVRDR